MIEDGISAIFCVIAKTNNPYPALWSRICSNSDSPLNDTLSPLLVSVPIKTSFASSMTNTVSYWSSAKNPPSCATAYL